MKTSFSVLVVFLVSLGAQAGLPEQKNLLPHDVFVPVGFDDNDNSQIVIRGEFPNTCYKVGPTKIEATDHEKKEIRVSNSAYVYNQEECSLLPVTVPYEKTVDLGLLLAEEYKIVFSDENGKGFEKARIKVDTADNRDNPDNYLYAPTAEVFVRDPASEKPTVDLRGFFTNTCLKVDEVKLPEVENRVQIVLPIAKMEKRQNCLDLIVPFHHTVQLSEKPEGLTLMHVRVMNGQSLNKFVHFE